MNAPDLPPDPLYERAKEILKANPGIGKNRLGRLLGIKAPSSRRRIVRYRGETEGHSTDPNYLRVRELKEKHLDWGAPRIALALGMSLDHAQLHIARWIGAQTFEAAKASRQAGGSNVGAQTETLPRGAEVQVSGDDLNRALSSRSTRIKSVEDLLVATNTDTRQWELERHVLNKWDVGCKDPLNGGILTEPLFQVKLWLRRRVVEQTIEKLLRELMADVKRQAPPKLPVVYPGGRAGMLEISIMDLHLGKLCWAPETGSRAYDPGIAQQLFWGALEDLLRRASGCRPEKILFVVGNDFFNVDTINKTTTAGTPQDEAMRWQESWVCGRQLLIAAVERLRQVAPVKALVVQGNHDYTKVYYLGDLLVSHFRNTPDVEIDNAPAARKYVHYGKNLLGFIHGDRIQHDKLPLLMAGDCRQQWAVTQFREWHLGHYHSKKTKVFLAHQDLHSVQIRLLPSLCPADAWHASMGYFSKPAAEAYFWDAEHGCVAIFTHSPN